MTKIIAKHLSLPIDHVIADSNKPVVKPGQTERPENTQLSTQSLQDIGIDVREDMTFDSWWSRNI
jgi:S-adenosylmethionine synthetase